MITVSNNIDGRKIPHEFFGLSTDEKPTGKINGCNLINGSIFLEIDTGKVFLYDEENYKWCEL
jgi:hypothetical protein